MASRACYLWALGWIVFPRTSLWSPHFQYHQLYYFSYMGEVPCILGVLNFPPYRPSTPLRTPHVCGLPGGQCACGPITLSLPMFSLWLPWPLMGPSSISPPSWLPLWSRYDCRIDCHRYCHCERCCKCHDIAEAICCTCILGGNCIGKCVTICIQG